ncbi:hypothetical protein SNE40_020763 [Patella caerulea]|uniref:Deleted in malignant brain tumors 1 protein-like n=1 Tax=Patella caerulea TaxID=87958 RepID=A0AAN8J704_PATCE
MAATLCIIKAIFAITVFLNFVQITQSEKVFGCYGPENSPCTNHELSCPNGKVIAFYKIAYGRKKSTFNCERIDVSRCSRLRCCQFENSTLDVEPFVDASIEDRILVNNQCSNKQTCNITSPYNPGFDYSYVYYWYGCIPSVTNFNIKDVTKSATTKEFLLYVSGAELPQPGLSCGCDIRSTSMIRIASLYVHLNGGSCRKVRISSGNKILFNCTDQGKVIFFQYLDISGTHIKFNIHSATLLPTDIVWLYFHVDSGLMDVSCDGCRNVAPALTEYRLVGGQNKFEGRIEVRYNNTWGTVCDDKWGPEEERVVCRSLGFNPSNTKAGHVTGGQGPIWLDNVVCTGTEDSLTDCQHAGWGENNCRHREDVAVVCKDVSYRLANGPGYHAGRLEVFFDNQWGTVCDHGFGREEASVVCRHLGLSLLRANALPGARYGRGTGPVWLDHVACDGSEPSLDKCIHPGWGSNGCTHAEDVSVACQPAAYRLVGSTVPYEGRVEIFHDNEWGTLCDDGWGPEEMSVVCSSLGYNPTTTKAFFGNGTGQIWLDDIVCSGNEPSIADCQHSKWGQHNCGHHEDAAVVCKPVEYRLADGSGPHEGRVEVFYNNEWGTVCDSKWGVIDAEVVCNGRGFSRVGAEAKMAGFFGPGTGPIWLSDVVCEGSEGSISECTHSGWRNHNCTHANDAAVICKYGPTELVLNTTNEHKFVDGQMVIDARDGEEVIITCLTDCVPDCMIHWHKINQQNIYNEAISNTSKLALSPIQRNQSGEYFCMAINPAISNNPVTKSVFINVIYGPTEVRFTLFSDVMAMDGNIEQLTIVENNNISVNCWAECYPACLVNWYRTNTFTKPLPTQNGELIWLNAKRAQTGNYYCSAINPQLADQRKVSKLDVAIIQPTL